MYHARLGLFSRAAASGGQANRCCGWSTGRSWKGAVLQVPEMEGSDTLQRARKIVLLNSIAQEVITALGPHILHLDSKKPTPPSTPSPSSEVLRPGALPHSLGVPTTQDHGAQKATSLMRLATKIVTTREG
ncbi:hypothetical protein FIBSPDRAFT_945618 [Athelia psychrophila]|uniref:Uncharacterized protein n=1 Tax=Athelia psychrophila TaxID=1759441 RepID=A0A166TJI2_9AGAM|nr:hypothetical protein FIBSPDRAFT_945618 [Fibularhizoctonia sp. CBS 109695]